MSAAAGTVPAAAPPTPPPPPGPGLGAGRRQAALYVLPAAALFAVFIA